MHRFRKHPPGGLDSLLTGAFLLALILPASAHWVTQSFVLAPGWNAVYLHVDATHATLETLVGSDETNPIQEIWLWQPAPATSQFVVSPLLPTTTGSQWLSWNRPTAETSGLQRLVGNAAYLVRVGGGANYTWNLKGKAVPPNYLWTSTGLNFIGFPAPAAAPPNFEDFLAPAPALQQAAEIFNYVGGELSASNPSRLYAFRTKPLRRGESYWIRSGNTFNRYFGPFEPALDGGAGLLFGSDLGQSRLRLRNLTASSLTVTLSLVNSELPPAGQPSLVGPPPLLLRGAISTVDLTYGFTQMATGPQTITLAANGQPGSESEVVFGLNRSQMPGQAGSVYAGILRLTDSLGLSQVDIPVSAEVASHAGLWVGSASIDNVQHYLKAYQTKVGGGLETTPGGAYIPTSTNTAPGAVARPYPLRLIIHNDGTTSRLLQRVFHGLDGNLNRVVTTRQSLMNPGHLTSARRISCTHLPWSAANPGWAFNGPLGSAVPLSVTVPLAHNDQTSNPFLHTYHPDHDGLDSTGQNPLQRGMESYDVTRVITLTLTLPANDFTSLTAGSGTLAGSYSELVTFQGIGSHSRQFSSSGKFAINRISGIAALTQ